jgi:hypothetical protein
MNESSPSKSSAPRPVLKLKIAARKSPPEIKTAPPPTRSPGKLGQKPGAAWSDELKHRMQEEMDALLTR